jgi:hypothetical protein
MDDFEPWPDIPAYRSQELLKQDSGIGGADLASAAARFVDKRGSERHFRPPMQIR